MKLDFSDEREFFIKVQNTLRKLEHTRNISLAYTAAQTGMFYCGQILRLERTDRDFPYKETGTINSVDEIRPFHNPTDEDFLVQGTTKEFLHIDKLRELLESEGYLFANWMRDRKEDDPIVLLAYSKILAAYIECRCWLGMALGAIRDAQKENS